MKKQRTVWWFGAALFVSAIGIAFIYSYKNTKNKSVLVGAALPLTGQLSYFGQPERLAIEMARNDFLSVPRSIDLQLGIEDSRSSAKDGVSAVQKLVSMEPAAVITSLTLVSMPAQPILSDRGIPQIALSVHPGISKDENTFRFYYGFDTEFLRILDHAKSIGAKRIAISWINTPELDDAIESVLKPVSAQLGMELVASVPHTFTESGFRDKMASIAAAAPDILILEDFGQFLPAMVEAARSQGLSELVGGIGFLTSQQDSRGRLADIPFVAPAYIVARGKSFVEFENRFRKFSNGLEASYDVVFTYDAAMNTFSAIEAAHNKSKKLKDELQSITQYAGVAGSVKVSMRAIEVPIAWARYSLEGNIESLKLEMPSVAPNE